MAEHQHGEHDQHMHHDMNQGMKDRRQANMGHTGSGHSHHAMMIADFKRRFWISLVITIPILILSPVIQQFLGVGASLRFTGDMYLLFIFSSIVYFYGGYPFLKGLIDEIKIKQPGMMTLVAVAITTAYLYSSAVVMGLMGEVFFWELATLIDIMLLGHWLEMKSIMGASRALEELARLMPSDAHKVMPDGSTRDVPLSELKLADKVLVKPGEKIPADGSVIEGITSVNESMLTGESNPVSKGTGAQVIGGAVNGEGSVTIEIRKTGKDSFLSQVIKLVNEAQQSKSKTQDLANRAAMWLTIIALGGGLITLLVWTILIKMNFGFSLERTVTVMVIACPHALGLAVPLVVAASTAIAARNGLLIRNRIAFEKARNIEAIIFDKTGTLTQGKFGVTDTVVIDKRYTAQDILQYAASVESHSEHPIANGIVTAIKDIPTVEGFKSIPGKGAQGRVQGKTVLVVSPGYLRENNLKVDAPQIEKLTQQGKTVVFVIMEEKIAGAIALADIIRPESKQAVTELKRMGIRCLMLTGDNRQVAKWVAEEIGLDEYFAEVLPQDKASKVKEIQQRGLTVAMTGDGVNDAPALAQADVGIAIGAGTDVAAETADIILVRSNPLDAVAILGLARMTYSKMIQNLLWATGYNVFAIPLAAGVLYRYDILLTPAMGAVLMSVSTIIVAINATLFKMPGSQV
ncbi:MAG TPA: heavy metal translocating P-type ATPase [Candidatus Margulisbacteria bacterium]|nr:heavy metal translocating P-type ATPase [Candidatus Margulisiibacteriota bacterium]